MSFLLLTEGTSRLNPMLPYEDDSEDDIVLVERLDPMLRGDDARDEIPKIKYHNYRQGNNCSIQNIS